MTKRITGNWIRKADSREVVAGAWPEVERILAEKYGVDTVTTGFLKCMVQDFGCISEYDGLNKLQGKETLLKKIRQDFQRSRTDFLRKLEGFSYSYMNDEYNLDDIPIFQEIIVDPLRLVYFNGNQRIVYFLVFPSRNYHHFGSSEFYHGNDEERVRMDRIRQERFIKRAINTSSLVVTAGEGSKILLTDIRQAYQVARKNLLRGTK